MKALPPAALSFELTPEEARIAASRIALRRALAGGLIGRHFAPLAAFVLALLFTAILAFTGLIGRRPAEILILLAAAAFMIHRLWTRRRFLQARRAALAWTERVRVAGPVILRIDADGLAIEGASLATRWRFSDGLEIEDAGGMIYVWPSSGDPAFWPTRAYADAPFGEAWLRYANSHGAVGRRAAAPAPDDDD